MMPMQIPVPGPLLPGPMLQVAEMQPGGPFTPFWVLNVVVEVQVADL